MTGVCRWVDIRTGTDDMAAVCAGGVAGVALFAASGVFCTTHFGVFVVGCVYITVLRLANLTNCLTYTSSLTTAVCRFVYNISAADSLTLLPMIVFIGSPDRCGIMSILRNGLSVCDFLITIAAINIAGIALLKAGGFLLVL